MIGDMPDGSIGVGRMKEENGVVEIDIYDTYYDGYECRIIAVSKWWGKTYTGKLISEIKPDKGARFNKAKFEDISLKKIKEFRFKIRPQTQPATQPVEEWGEPVEGVQVRLRTDKKVWKAGEVPSFKYDVRNHETSS